MATRYDHRTDGLMTERGSSSTAHLAQIARVQARVTLKTSAARFSRAQETMVQDGLNPELQPEARGEPSQESAACRRYLQVSMASSSIRHVRRGIVSE